MPVTPAAKSAPCVEDRGPRRESSMDSEDVGDVQSEEGLEAVEGECRSPGERRGPSVSLNIAFAIL